MEETNNVVEEKPKMIIVKFDITPEQEEQVEFLKTHAKTKTRSKVFKFALKKTFDLYKEIQQ